MTLRPTWAAGALLLALAWPAGSARADQLIQIPTADLVTRPSIEYVHRIDGTDEGYATAKVPVGLNYELMFRYSNNWDGEYRIEGGAMLQILPDGIITPGIALGVWDLTNSGPWERRAFLVITKGLDPANMKLPSFINRVQLTGGIGTGRFSGPLAAVRVDLPARISLIGEYDARRLNFGFWFQPLPPITLKAELQNGNPFIGGELALKF